MYVVRTEELKAYYVLSVFGKQKTVKAVDNVTITIDSNQIFGIAGESGCGKTTLLKVLFGLVEAPLRLISGKVFYHDGDREYDVYSLDSKKREQLKWKFIAYVPQGSMSVLNPVIRIKESFRDVLESHLEGKSKKDVYDLAAQHLESLGLPENVLEAYPHQLSGGMRQRVSIALATILKPRVIIADEPTTALDVVTQRGVLQLLKEIQEMNKNTIILVTHDMGVHANVTNRIAIMYAGRVIEESTAEQIFENPLHPYTKFLIASLPKFSDRERKASAPGCPPSLADLPNGCAFHPRCPNAFDRCKTEIPLLKNHSVDHKVACWLLEGN